MKKQQSVEMPSPRQERFPSGDPDLGATTAIPRNTQHDLHKVYREDFNYRVPGPGSQVRKDGRA